MNFNDWKEFYDWNWVTKEQLIQAVKQDLLTPEQYKEIVNFDYPADNQTHKKENIFIRMFKKIYE